MLVSQSHLTAYIIYCYYGLDGQDFDSRHNQPVFVFAKTVQTGSEDQFSGSSPGGKVNHLSLPSVEDKNWWSCYFKPPPPALGWWWGDGHLYLLQLLIRLRGKYLGGTWLTYLH
jgi:hypothetical protein